MSEAKPRSHGRLAARPGLAPRELMTDAPDLAGAWRARIITLFPEAFPGTLGLSLTGKALAEGLWQLETIDLRPFGEGRHRNVDDTPAGGGAGMVLRADVVARALDRAAVGTPMDRARWPVVYLSPRGPRFDQPTARRWAAAVGITLLCGRFEGVDQRLLDHYAIEEVSLGDFVLTGGEIAAQAMLDATVRLLPGVLGNAASAEEESFSTGLLEYPQYTRPQVWEGREIPPVLMSGHHGEIAKWRKAEAERITQERRPDLWEKAHTISPPDDKSARLIRHLSWATPEAEQRLAVDQLADLSSLQPQWLAVENLDKSQFQNASRVLATRLQRGDRRCAAALLGWLRDLNWPGGVEAFSALTSAIFVEPDIVEAQSHAMRDNDEVWSEALTELVSARAALGK